MSTSTFQNTTIHKQIIYIKIKKCLMKVVIHL